MNTPISRPNLSAASSRCQELSGLPEARIVDGASSDDIPPATYKFRLYSGKQIEIFGANLYRLDGQLCKGKYTGDDFCDVSRYRKLAIVHSWCHVLGCSNLLYYTVVARVALRS